VLPSQFLSCSAYSAMEDIEVAFLVSLYVVLVQTLCASRPQFAVEDDILLESTVGGAASLDSRYCRIAMSTAALYDYRISACLICFDDDLRFWVKPRCTLWFSQFLMSLYDDSRWIEIFRMDKGTVSEICYRLRVPIE
jgi:hypothetical protein